jgi:hypothetical protein
VRLRLQHFHARAPLFAGVCRLPWLKTLVHVETPLTGGGYFSGPNDLKTHGWDHSEKVFLSDDGPFTIERDPKRHFGYELANIYGRFERNGWVSWTAHSSLRLRSTGTARCNAAFGAKVVVWRDKG